MFSGPKRNWFDFISQTLQTEITQNQGDVVLLLKAGNGLLGGREGAAGSDEIQVVTLFYSLSFLSYLENRIFQERNLNVCSKSRLYIWISITVAVLRCTEGEAF